MITGFFQGTEMPTAGWWEALWPDPAKVLASIGLKPNMEVVDLCSGDGWFTLQIAKVAHHVVAIDIDRALLDLARLRLTESGVTNCDFVEGDAYDIAKLTQETSDFVFMANAFHGVPDRPRLARAVLAALKPGGVYGLVDNSARAGTGAADANTLHRIDESFEIKEIESAGFKLVATSDIYRNPADDRTWPFFKARGTQDRFALKFVKP